MWLDLPVRPINFVKEEANPSDYALKGEHIIYTAKVEKGFVLIHATIKSERDGSTPLDSGIIEFHPDLIATRA